MTRLGGLANKSVGTEAFGLTNYDQLQTDIAYLVVAGGSLASATTLAITAAFHPVTGTTTIDNLSDASGASIGQQVKLMFASALTVRHNGGGTGNIRTLTGADVAVAANQILTFLFDGTNWWVVSGGGAAIFRKTTSRAVSNTVSELDLLNSEFTVPENALGLNRLMRLAAWGTIFNNSGGARDIPRLKVKVGSGPTTVLDTSVSLSSVLQFGPSSTYYWRLELDWFALGATNSQLMSMRWRIAANPIATATAQAFATGTGTIAALINTGDINAVGSNPSSIDGTVAQAFQITCTNPTATATFTTTLLGALAEIV